MTVWLATTGHGGIDLAVPANRLQVFDRCTARMALMASARGAKRVRGLIGTVSARCLADGTALGVVEMVLAGVPTPSAEMGRLLRGCADLDAAFTDSWSGLAGALRGRSNLDLSLCASVHVVVAGSELCRLLEGDVHGRAATLRRVRSHAFFAVEYAWAAAMAASAHPRAHASPHAAAMDQGKVAKTFTKDLRLMYDASAVDVTSGRVLGGPYVHLEAGGFGTLWAEDDAPAWYKEDTAERADPAVLDGWTSPEVGNADVVYWHVPAGASRDTAAALVARIRAAGGGAHTPAHAVHAPGLDPASVGDLVAAGAFMLPEDAFRGTDATHMPTVRRRIGALLPDLAREAPDPAPDAPADWLASPPFLPAAGGWGDDDGEAGLAEARRLRRERIALEGAHRPGF